MEYTTTNKGKQCALYNGYSYYFKRQNQDGVRFWRCSKERKTLCRGDLKTRDGEILSAHEHSCGPPDEARLELKKVIQRAKKRVLEEDVPVSEVFAQESEGFLQKYKHAYKISALKKGLQQCKARHLKAQTDGRDDGSTSSMTSDNEGPRIDTSWIVSSTNTESSDSITIKEEKDMFLEEDESVYVSDDEIVPLIIKQERDDDSGATTSHQAEISTSKTLRENDFNRTPLQEARQNTETSVKEAPFSPQAVGESNSSNYTTNRGYQPTSQVDDAYDHFGKYVASMLRTIGPPDAVTLQQQIAVLLINKVSGTSSTSQQT